jgi:hypothetical protein
LVGRYQIYGRKLLTRSKHSMIEEEEEEEEEEMYQSF